MSSESVAMDHATVARRNLARELPQREKARLVIDALKQARGHVESTVGSEQPSPHDVDRDLLIKQVVAEFHASLQERMRRTKPNPEAHVSQPEEAGTTIGALAKTLECEHPCVTAIALSSRPTHIAKSVLLEFRSAAARRAGLALVHLNNLCWHPVDSAQKLVRKKIDARAEDNTATAE
ncbi:MAG: hypothetical protein Q9M41_05100 [Paracoccaceae bacterium]|nr:hypothetical protein [Paracoccaceae bacterium]